MDTLACSTLAGAIYAQCICGYCCTVDVFIRAGVANPSRNARGGVRLVIPIQTGTDAATAFTSRYTFTVQIVAATFSQWAGTTDSVICLEVALEKESSHIHM